MTDDKTGEKDIIENVKKLQRINQQLQRDQNMFGKSGDDTRFRKKVDEELAEGNTLTRSLETISSRYRNNSQAPRNMEKLFRQVEQEKERYTQLSNEINQQKTHYKPAVVDNDDLEKGRDNNGVYQSSQGNQQEFADVGLVAINQINQEHEQRYQAIEKIADDAVQLKEAFEDLNTLVTDQQGDIDKLETNVNQTKDRVEAGTYQLKKAEEHQRTARKIQCYILLCVLIILGLIAGLLGGLLPHRH